MQSQFFLCVLRLTQMYAGKVYSGRSSLDQRLRQRARSNRRRVRSIRSVQTFAIVFANLRKLEENVRSGSVSFCSLSGIEVRTW